MTIKTIRTTGNIEDDLFLFSDEAQSARTKYDELREKSNQRNGVPTFNQELASIFAVATIALALHYEVEIKNYFLKAVGTNTSNSCYRSSLEAEIKKLEKLGFIVSCSSPK